MDSNEVLSKVLLEQIGLLMERVSVIAANTRTRLEALEERVRALEHLAAQ